MPCICTNLIQMPFNIGHCITVTFLHPIPLHVSAFLSYLFIKPMGHYHYSVWTKLNCLSDIANYKDILQYEMVNHNYHFKFLHFRNRFWSSCASEYNLHKIFFFSAFFHGAKFIFMLSVVINYCSVNGTIRNIKSWRHPKIKIK